MIIILFNNYVKMFIGDLMKKFVLWIIKMYQITPLHCHSLCRFKPTCSQYMIDSINYYGLLKGGFLGIKRILKCHPFGKYGYDPVPLKGKK